MLVEERMELLMERVRVLNEKWMSMDSDHEDEEDLGLALGSLELKIEEMEADVLEMEKLY